MISEEQRLRESCDFILDKTGQRPDAAVILGSGLGSAADFLENAQTFDSRDIINFPSPTQKTHEGKLIFGKHGGKNIAVMKGRYHIYEGFTAAQVVFPLRTLLLAGAKRVIITNAAGGVNPDFSVGDIMLIKDHINLTPINALSGANVEVLGERFPDMSNIYTGEIGQKLICNALGKGIGLKYGVYFYMPGPSYETPAEIRAIRLLGGDAVGMSTVHEAVAASHAGAEVIGLSIITNMASGMSGALLSDDEVRITGAENSEKMKMLIKESIML